MATYQMSISKEQLHGLFEAFLNQVLKLQAAQTRSSRRDLSRPGWGVSKLTSIHVEQPRESSPHTAFPRPARQFERFGHAQQERDSDGCIDCDCQ